jgi:predicted 2-oxoglutarate/Fe(II)-dependent dioxygenase YbiX
MTKSALSSIASDLASCLGAVRRPGDFWTAGTAVLGLPSLEVEGVGPVALPLLSIQAAQLIACAEAAPFGRGEATIVDQTVRRSWQIGLDRVRIGGRHWATTLAAIVGRASEGLGVSDPVDAEFYKLLIYDEGSFFVGHRDTEKQPGMFATLLVVLPSRFEGGALIVRHQGRQVQLDLRSPDPAEAAFAAFYADCVHEVLPVTQGHRLTLVYNLLRRGKGSPPAAPGYRSEQHRLTALLQRWGTANQTASTEVPEKLVYLLEHSYTQIELGFATLKGADAAQAGVLAAAANDAQCDLHLALLTIEESGGAEYSGNYYPSRHGRWSDEEDAFEAGEIFDRSVMLSDWRHREGNAVSLGPIPVGEDEFAPPDASEDLTPDEEHFHEATGNEGASFERTYRRAALVLWPSARIFAVLSQAGLAVTLPYLDELAGQWDADGAVPEAPLWCAAHDLAGHMLAQWPEQAPYRRESEAPNAIARLLAALTRLGDAVMLEKALTTVVAAGCHETQDNAAIITGIACLPPARRGVVITRVIDGTADTAFAACADLLARAAASGQIQPELHLASAGLRLVEALPRDLGSGAVRGSWHQPVAMQPETVADLLNGLGRVDNTLAVRAADHMLTAPKRYGPDAVLIPALRRLIGMDIPRDKAFERLRVASLAHLRTRIAKPLAPPVDWRRASSLPCGCPRCTALARFLADPESRTWRFKAAEANRAHLQDTIKHAHCDVDITTEKQGSPYTLICVKNQASYDQRANQRKRDLADMKLLER